ncbi:hypothetical protein CkaCkLH20_01880 [Colletotrichum karsti]|uniref:Amidase domain-containing protein n=1 Tax=Colletotrichum karsti TaxID=1095194 RepID=A0A9P6IC12_9PEZI|nr:uncharacterized protein CkaCkLH20_01880 [Colletotrichum karsti]KAF9880838.1 hypothetical protein CkaCkLH20_01880 [Colletotrichum karsti]
MTSTTLPIIERLPHVSGTPAFEAARKTILEEFAAKVPLELHISRAIIDNPPKNVTALPRDSGLLSPEELEITETYDVVALAEAIAARKYTAVAVVTAFSKRAIIAHQLTCCLSEWFMDEAIEHAKALDEHLERTGKTVGPLHGIPIAVKEMVPLAGHYTSLGFLITRQQAEKDCQMVAILRKAGAVFHCKTLQPQGIMHLETVSIQGRTLNPYNIDLSAGGSTGGGAAVVALRGSLLAIATDIGGSIRGPAAFCGLYGFKSTSYYLPMRGFTGDSGYIGELNVLASSGPLSVSLRDMDLFVSVLKNAQPHLEDPRLIPIPWTGLETQRKSVPLKVGFMMNDGIVMPQPPVIRALEWAREKLSKSPAFEVKDFTAFKTAEAITNINRIILPDGGKMAKGAMAATGEPPMLLTKMALQNPDVINQDLDAAGVLQQRVARDKFRCEFAEHWTAQDVDVLISPAYVGPACAHDTAIFSNYLSFWNYVDYPSAVLPTRIKASSKGAETYSSQHMNPLSEDCKRVRQFWEDGDFEGAPIGIQVTARKYFDNDLFVALKELQKVLDI